MKEIIGGKEENMIQIQGEHLVKYLIHLAKYTSGENINNIGKIMLNVLAPILDQDAVEYVRQNIMVLRRDANKHHPPIQKAADPLSLRDLETLVHFSRIKKLGHIEAQAINIMVVAFATISRVAEIISLKVEDVTRDGHFISIRSKTHAATWIKQTKCVEDSVILKPSVMLKRARFNAIAANRTLLFFNRSNNSQLSTGEVTNALKRISRKIGWNKRITAHSARRGAAVEAVMARVPPLVIQSLGTWSDINTMQIYIGNAVRERFGLLQMLDRRYKGNVVTSWN